MRLGKKGHGFRGWVSNAVAAGLFSLVAACGGGGSGGEDGLPTDVTVAVPRTNLSYAYYANDRDGVQLRETKAHITHHFVGHWYGSDVAMEQTRDACASGLKVFHALFRPYSDPDLDATLTKMFMTYSAAGVLRCVDILYPQDEPEKYGYSDVTVAAGNATIRRVMARFPEMAATKLAVVYSADKKYPGLASFDLAGIDDYDAREGIFTNGQYASFASLLRPDQGIILVPGGADRWRQVPLQFILKADKDMRVRFVLVFAWMDNLDPANGAAGPGVRSNGLAPAYCAWGMKIKYPGITMPC